MKPIFCYKCIVIAIVHILTGTLLLLPLHASYNILYKERPTMIKSEGVGTKRISRKKKTSLKSEQPFRIA